MGIKQLGKTSINGQLTVRLIEPPEDGPIDFTGPMSETEVQESVSAASGRFGYNAAVSGNGKVAVITALNGGVGYVFELENGSWVEKYTITGVTTASDIFGEALAISENGDTIIASQPAYFQGRCYAFHRLGNAWLRQPTILGTVTDGNFGQAVCLSKDGTRMLVGAYSENINSGEIYDYELIEGTWTRTDRTFTFTRDSTGGAGAAIAMNADSTLCVIGKFGSDIGGTNAGRASICEFVDGNWVEIQQINASDRRASANFGISCDMSDDGNTIIVGAHRHGLPANNAGKVYIFTRVEGTWTQTIMLQPDAAGNNFMGGSVSISGDGETCTFGGYGVGGVGAVYVYGLIDGSWSQLHKFTGNYAGGRYGQNVDLGNRHVVSGGYLSTVNTTQDGVGVINSVI